MIVKTKKKLKVSNILIHLFFILLAVLCIYPFLLVIGVSFTNEKSILNYGFQVIPTVFSLDAYKYVLKNLDTIVNAYMVTIFTTVVGTLLSVLTITLYAYALSRKEFYFRKFFTFFIFFTMIFNGGMVPWYIVCVRVLHINNTIFAMILPYVISAWYVMIMRTFFITTIPDSIIESARIDGAGEFRTLFQIVLPLAVPGVATIALFSTLAYWNDWWLPLMLVKDTKLYNLQYLIYQILNNMDFVNQLADQGRSVASLPSESARMAVCVISIGPIIFAYLFFQKYFVKGLTIGAVKG
jgi:putative aldouronate transport system permease protein